MAEGTGQERLPAQPPVAPQQAAEHPTEVDARTQVAQRHAIVAVSQQERFGIDPFLQDFKSALDNLPLDYIGNAYDVLQSLYQTASFNDKAWNQPLSQNFRVRYLNALRDDLLQKAQNKHDESGLIDDNLSVSAVNEIAPLTIENWAIQQGFITLTNGEPRETQNGSGFFKGIPERMGDAVSGVATVAVDALTSLKTAAVALATQATATLKDAGNKVPDLTQKVREKLDALNVILQSEHPAETAIIQAKDALSIEVKKLSDALKPAQEASTTGEKPKEDTTPETEPDFWKMVQDEGWKATLVFGIIKLGEWFSNSDSWQTWGGGMAANLISMFGIKKESKWATDGLKKCGIRAIPDTDGKLTFEYASPDTMIARLTIENESDRKVIESFTLSELPNKDSQKDTPPQSVNADNNKKIVYNTYFEKLQILQTKIMGAGVSGMSPDTTKVSDALLKEPVQDALYAYFSQTTQGVASADTSETTS